jgi:hypothetical protein
MSVTAHSLIIILETVKSFARLKTGVIKSHPRCVAQIINFFFFEGGNFTGVVVYCVDVGDEEFCAVINNSGNNPECPAAYMNGCNCTCGYSSDVCTTDPNITHFTAECPNNVAADACFGFASLFGNKVPFCGTDSIAPSTSPPETSPPVTSSPTSSPSTNSPQNTIPPKTPAPTPTSAGLAGPQSAPPKTSAPTLGSDAINMFSLSLYMFILIGMVASAAGFA